MGALHGIEGGRENMMRKCKYSPSKVSDKETSNSKEEGLEPVNMDDMLWRMVARFIHQNAKSKRRAEQFF